MNISNKENEHSLCHSTDMVLNDELLQTTFKWMFWSPHHLVKDDVFFAPSTTTTTTTTACNNKDTILNNWVPTPCLSPVTSPSDFLYDQEPLLFDGIENDDCYNNKEEMITKEESITINLHQYEDDWSTLFSGDEYDFLPLTPSSTVTTTEHSSAEEEEVEELQVQEPQVISTKRKRVKDVCYNNNNSKKLKKSSCTLFQNLTQLGIDWCRYCGTTEGVNWRPGPWGKRTLCNKHGCDYKGYGLASRLPRLDLSAFTREKLQERKRPIVQQFCVLCQLPENTSNNKLIACEGGCSRAYHQHCHTMKSKYCSTLCHENKQKNKVVVDLPRKYLPLMRLQQQQQQL